MNNIQFKNVFFITLGLIIILVAASSFLIRLFFVLLGVYFLKIGLSNRSYQNFNFHIHRFKNRF